MQIEKKGKKLTLNTEKIKNLAESQLQAAGTVSIIGDCTSRPSSCCTTTNLR